jgi:hypothetical protein
MIISISNRTRTRASHNAPTDAITRGDKPTRFLAGGGRKLALPNRKNVIGERVRLARLAIRPAVSQENLSGRLAAKGIQITQTAISKLENRQRYVMDYEALAIAKALKVSVSWLYGESKTAR